MKKVLNPHLISELQKGKITVLNDDKKQLIEIIVEAFTDFKIPEGSEKYYFLDDITSKVPWVGGLSNIKNLPVFKCSEFYMFDTQDVLNISIDL